MKIHCDADFMIGGGHEVCQDYAAFSDGKIVLSDGCSCVRDHRGVDLHAKTDVGARLLALTMMETSSGSGLLAGMLAECSRTNLGLSKADLTATLLHARVEPNQRWVKCSCYGDGIIATRSRKSQMWRVSTFDYGGYPPYLSYEIEQKWTEERPRPDVYPEERLVSTTNDDAVVLMSDGANSFFRDGSSVYVMDRLLDFRRMKGRFITRQLRGVLRELSNEGIHNFDDISMAGMYLEMTEDEVLELSAAECVSV